jgi:hypothetical protein
MRARQRGARALSAALSLIAVASGCNAVDATSFDRLRADTPVLVLHAPGTSSAANGYGSVLVGYGTTLVGGSGRPVMASRFVASAGAGSVYRGYRVFDEVIVDATTTSGLRLSAGPDPVYEGCVDGLFCGPGSSVSLASVPAWPVDAATTHYGCVVATSGDTLTDSRLGTRHEQVQVRCEADPTRIVSLDTPNEGLGFGMSAAGLPARHPLGAAIFGAPGDASGTGELYLLQGYPVNGFVPVGLRGVPVGAGIGRTMAVAPLADGRLMVITSGLGPGLDPRHPADAQVVVATLDPAGGSTVHACLGRTTRAAYGSALALGDLDADGTPDVVVGSGTPTIELVGAMAADQGIELYSGAALLAGSLTGCGQPAVNVPTPTVLPCMPDAAAGFSCARSPGDAYAGFGTSLAVGDVDADGRVDLIVGAPYANVRTTGGGAVIVLGGTGTLAGLGQVEHAVLSYPSVGTGAQLGLAVATVPGSDRDEIVAGAPGVGHLVMFFCSGIPGDRPEDFAGVEGMQRGCVRPPRTRGAGDAGPMPGDGGAIDAGTPVDAGDVDAGDVDAGGSDAGDLDASADAGVDAV